nr:RDD family protein [uncultured Flavobacterium sp.]
MSQLTITTTQNVNINFTASNTGERVLAYLIDMAIFLAYYFFINLLFSFTGIENLLATQDPWTQRAIYSMVYLPIMLYSLVCETFMEGQSFGKKVMKLKVIKMDGYQAGFGDYLIRWIFRVVETAGFLGIIGLIVMMINKDSRRLGDLAAGTAVISLKNNINISHTILRELENNYVPTYPQVIKLTDNDVRIIKETYDASYRIADFATMDKLQTKIEQVMGITSVNNNSLGFVDTILKDYNYYTQNMLKT